MDRISIAIEAALAVGITEARGKSGPHKVSEAYQMLKKGLHQTFGPESDLIDALTKLEKKPDSLGRKALVREEVAAAGADEDPQLLAAAQAVLDELRKFRADSIPLTRNFQPPLQRPARPESFSGREAELAHLLAAIRPGHTVALYGPAGIGKNALAAEAVWQLCPGPTLPDDFPAGVIYQNFYTQPRVDIALEQIVRALGQEPVPSPYEALGRILAEQPVLLLLGNVEQADDLRGILEIAGRSGILLTGIQPAPAPAECREVEPLSPDEVVTLLRTLVRVSVNDKTTARRIGELVGRTPLAVKLAGHYLAARPEGTGDYVAWLEQTPLPGLNTVQRQQQSIPLLLQRSMDQLNQTAHDVLAVAGLLAFAPFELSVISSTLALEPDQGVLPAIRRLFKQDPAKKGPDVGQALRNLMSYGLLHRVGRCYELSHPLIYAYARRRLPRPTKAVRRLATYYVALAWDQSGLGLSGYTRLNTERPHIMKVLDDCLAAEDWEATHGLAVAIEDYLDQQGHWAERIIANEAGLMAAWQLGRPSEGAWLGNLGDTYRTMGYAKWAIEHFEKALDTARRIGDRHGEGNSLGNLGLAYRDLGQMKQAFEYLQQSQAVFEEINSPRASLVQDWLIALSEEIDDE